MFAIHDSMLQHAHQANHCMLHVSLVALHGCLRRGDAKSWTKRSGRRWKWKKEDEVLSRKI
ncbi:hypothetical protein BGZ63DRAFT_379226 [Mariannaea sp. PMI_226]|nr:hypothetical protein BGZ63DRAFT_379226 [Mariannaea sp. PMI_226]